MKTKAYAITKVDNLYYITTPNRLIPLSTNGYSTPAKAHKAYSYIKKNNLIINNLQNK